ncbi:MAG: hypothetical protein K6G74_04520 [Bacilli bacterium]|nr:hypothetical protein [Bacilli bacterium]
MTIAISSGDVSFNITKDDANNKVGTMKFLPLTDKTISIRFDFVSDFRETFVFAYEYDLFSVARQCEENDSTEQYRRLLGNYPYVETKLSLHEKLSKITFEGEAKSVLEERRDMMQNIAINGSGKLTFEYEGAAFDPTNHFYACEGLSFMPKGFSLRDESGKKIGEGYNEWYYISDGDILK